MEIEPQVTVDIYTTVTPPVRPFLFSPDLNVSSAFSIFSSKFDTGEDLLTNRRLLADDSSEASLHLKLSALRTLSSKWVDEKSPQKIGKDTPYEMDLRFDDDEDEDEDLEDKAFEDEPAPLTKSSREKVKGIAKTSPKSKAAPSPKGKTSTKSKPPLKPLSKTEKPKVKRIMPKEAPSHKKGKSSGK